MDSNPCATRWRMKNLCRKKTRTKVVHKNVSQGYIKVKRHIMKNLQLSFVSVYTKLYKILKKKNIY